MMTDERLNEIAEDFMYETEVAQELLQEVFHLRAENAALRSRAMSEDELVELVSRVCLNDLRDTDTIRKFVRDYLKSRAGGGE